MPVGFGRNPWWPWTRMTSTSSSSPATPTPPMQRVPPRCAPSMESMASLFAVVAEESDGFWEPRLGAAEIDACKAAFAAISWKLERPAIIDKEYSSLRLTKRENTARYTAAAANAASKKDRYGDVLPFDDTRVILQTTNASESDYINASFIESPADGHLFIATQGPLKHTVVDFWEMVMQQRCSAIIMLTSLIDGSLEKCAPYFPSAANQHQIHGRLRVTNKAQSFSTHSIAKRVFEVQTVEKSQEPPLIVLHLEYLQWPDHGVPLYTRPIRELYRCISVGLPPDSGPVVVHCSAGIGRSGTYIAIDHTLRRVLKGDRAAVDLHDTVTRLRDQRIGMVQTKAQYHFVYAAVLHELEDLLEESIEM